ncbi:hypothetical protein AXE80_04535 [Wenyingzhuangia fucanilytica]|uniref:DUF5655 domain-containing protein n=1 Tax=Wenyingzhuangia fucanilytica TaxID=1790137 RepID=A0A1B1Y478_9FLAO|nr:hypothetical protein [Wenyingzhuangia fucanilytica]ANW95586.1 hypothetical protein AXE80_04535 [Wenyingzhuangia fucanilytica]
MEQFLDYYNFSEFNKDTSSFFDTIAYSWIKDDLYIVLEKKEGIFNIHFTSYSSKNDIGKQKPQGLNTLIENFKLDNNEHRKIVQQYLDYN